MSKVTAKYQITLPIEVRKEMGIVPGTEVDIVREGNNYLLVVNPIEGLRKKWRGKYKAGLTAKEYIEMVRGPIN
jgi:AbrB family looped-hinge helix DNA binding protein